MLFRGLDRAYRAGSPVGSLQHNGELCALGNRNSSREMPTFRDLRFLPVVTKMRRFTFFAKRIAFQPPPDFPSRELSSRPPITPGSSRTLSGVSHCGTCERITPKPGTPNRANRLGCTT